MLLCLSFFISCYEDSDLAKRVESLETFALSSINQQIISLKESIVDLEILNNTLKSKIDSIESTGASQTELDTLQFLFYSLSVKTESLKELVWSEVLDTKQWAENKFATLELYSLIVDELISLKANILSDYNELEDQIDKSIDSIYKYIDIALSGYYSSPEIDSLLDVLKSKIEEIESYIRNLDDDLSSRIDAETHKNRKRIKVLCFGNSFTEDSMGYVPFILKNLTPDLELTLAIAYIGGCPLIQHCVNITKQCMTLGSTTYYEMPYTLHISMPGEEKWFSESNLYAEEILLKQDWDVITFQQNGSNVDSDWDTFYVPYIYSIHKSIFNVVSKPVKLGWLSVHSSYRKSFAGLLEKWEGSMVNTQKIEELTGNQVLFPYGTAIQNLRTTPLVDLGDGGFLMADTAHLHEGIGCLSAAYVNAIIIAELAGYNNVSIIGETTRPSKEWCSNVNIPAPNYGTNTKDVVGITENNIYTAQIAAIMAVKHPYKVTDCSSFYKE